MKTYEVTCKLQYPAWDEKDGFTAKVAAKSKSEAIKSARSELKYLPRIALALAIAACIAFPAGGVAVDETPPPELAPETAPVTKSPELVWA